MGSRTSELPEGAEPRVGLCSVCRHARTQRSARGVVFWRCGRAERDEAWARYPRLPVLRCPGFGRVPADC